MPAKRLIVRLIDPPPHRKCLCGSSVAFALVTESEMRGKFRGTGKTRRNRAYRCRACITALAAKFGLKVPDSESN